VKISLFFCGGLSVSGHTITQRGNLLEFDFHGVWGEAERQAWQREIVPATKSLRPGFQFLVDFSDYPAQEPATQEMHGAMMGTALALGLHSAVHVVPSQVVRAQMKRASDATPDAARFHYVATMAEGRELVRRLSDQQVTPSASGAARHPTGPGESPSFQPVGNWPAARPPARSAQIACVVAATASAATGPWLGAVPASALALLAAGLAGVALGRGQGAGPDAEPQALRTGEGNAQSRANREVMAELADLLGSESSILRQRSSTLVAVAEEVSSAARQVQADAAGISERLAQMAGDTREMASSISEIGSQSIIADQLTGDASKQAGRTRDLVGALDASSRDIGNVVSLIGQIAEQTNMLALNATIEAARAGSAGRGFAVVASEVKELSRATARATGQIERSVAAIQRDVVSTAEALDGIGTSVEDVRSAQDVVASAVTEQQNVTSGIETAVESTTTGAAHLVDRTRQLTLATSEVTAAASEATATSERLDVLTERLRQLARS
jgi:hypothetical protein